MDDPLPSIHPPSVVHIGQHVSPPSPLASAPNTPRGDYGARKDFEEDDDSAPQRMPSKMIVPRRASPPKRRTAKGEMPFDEPNDEGGQEMLQAVPEETNDSNSGSVEKERNNLGLPGLRHPPKIVTSSLESPGKTHMVSPVGSSSTSQGANTMEEGPDDEISPNKTKRTRPSIRTTVEVTRDGVIQARQISPDRRDYEVPKSSVSVSGEVADLPSLEISPRSGWSVSDNTAKNNSPEGRNVGTVVKELSKRLSTSSVMNTVQQPTSSAPYSTEDELMGASRTGVRKKAQTVGKFDPVIEAKHSKAEVGEKPALVVRRKTVAVDRNVEASLKPRELPPSSPTGTNTQSRQQFSPTLAPPSSKEDVDPLDAEGLKMKKTSPSRGISVTSIQTERSTTSMVASSQVSPKGSNATTTPQSVRSRTIPLTPPQKPEKPSPSYPRTPPNLLRTSHLDSDPESNDNRVAASSPDTQKQSGHALTFFPSQSVPAGCGPPMLPSSTTVKSVAAEPNTGAVVPAPISGPFQTMFNDAKYFSTAAAETLSAASVAVETFVLGPPQVTPSAPEQLVAKWRRKKRQVQLQSDRARREEARKEVVKLAKMRQQASTDDDLTAVANNRQDQGRTNQIGRVISTKQRNPSFVSEREEKMTEEKKYDGWWVEDALARRDSDATEDEEGEEESQQSEETPPPPPPSGGHDDEGSLSPSVLKERLSEEQVRALRIRRLGPQNSNAKPQPTSKSVNGYTNRDTLDSSGTSFSEGMGEVQSLVSSLGDSGRESREAPLSDDDVIVLEKMEFIRSNPTTPVVVIDRSRSIQSPDSDLLCDELMTTSRMHTNDNGKSPTATISPRSDADYEKFALQYAEEYIAGDISMHDDDSISDSEIYSDLKVEMKTPGVNDEELVLPPLEAPDEPDSLQAESEANESVSSVAQKETPLDCEITPEVEVEVIEDSVPDTALRDSTTEAEEASPEETPDSESVYSFASEGTEVLSNKKPTLVKSLDDINGICKGDIIVSLVSSKSTPQDSSLGGNVQVTNAVQRMRIMRRKATGKDRTQKSKQKLHEGSESLYSRKRSALPVDVDEGRVVGGIKQVGRLEQDAIGHLKNNEYEDALELYEDIIYAYTEGLSNIDEAQIQEKVDLRPYIGNALHNIGIVHFLNQDFMEALTFFQKATSARKGCLGENHPDTLTSVIKSAMCQYGLENYASAHQELESALELCRGNCRTATDFAQVAEVLNNLGCLSFMCSEPETALKMFSESLEVQHSIMSHSLYGGPVLAGYSTSLNLSVTRANLAFVHMFFKKHDAAIVAFEASLFTQQMLLHDSNETLMGTMDHLAVSNLMVGNKDKAVLMLERMLRAQEEAFGVHDERWNATRMKLEVVQKNGEESKPSNSIKVSQKEPKRGPKAVLKKLKSLRKREA